MHRRRPVRLGELHRVGPAGSSGGKKARLQRVVDSPHTDWCYGRPDNEAYCPDGQLSNRLLAALVKVGPNKGRLTTGVAQAPSLATR